MATIAHWGNVLKRHVSQGNDGLSEHWPAADIEAACHAVGHVWRDRFWTPLLTIRTFLLQVLHAGSSCRAAVAMALGRIPWGQACLHAEEAWEFLSCKVFGI